MKFEEIYSRKFGYCTSESEEDEDDKEEGRVKDNNTPSP